MREKKKFEGWKKKVKLEEIRKFCEFYGYDEEEVRKDLDVRGIRNDPSMRFKKVKRCVYF
jgi:hypothetical protein